MQLIVLASRGPALLAASWVATAELTHGIRARKTN